MSDESPRRAWEEEGEEESSRSRLAALALLAVAAVTVYLLFFTGEDYTVTAEFANASQLVPGNEVTAKALDKTTIIPGELAAFQSIEAHAKVTGFVEEIAVDRGSRVTKGQTLAKLSAPELEARRAEALARIPEIEAQRVEAEAKLAGAESTFEKLREAAKTPGVVAGNDVVLAEKAASKSCMPALRLRRPASRLVEGGFPKAKAAASRTATGTAGLSVSGACR